MERFLKSRYRIGEKISENPFSVSYKGSFLATDKPLAIKIYKRGTLNSDIIKSMKQKVKDFSFFTYHGIAKLIDGDYGWQGFYYVREYVPGQSLGEILESGDKIGEEKSLVIGEEICRALAYTHKRGIIHGALKPNNVIIDKKGVVKIVDFVIEGEIKQSMPQKAISILTDADYTSPEELLGQPASFSSDIYALGLMLYKMLTGNFPFSGKKLTARLKALDREMFSPLPRYLQGILGRALQVDPLLRFSSIIEFCKSLENKNLYLTPPQHEAYINLFDNTVAQYGEEFKKEDVSFQDLGRIRLRWGLEKHRNWILAVILVLALISGLLYAFLFIK